MVASSNLHMSRGQRGDSKFFEELNQLGPALLSALEAFEQVRRLLHPPRIGTLRDALQPLRDALAPALESFEQAKPPEEIADLAARLAEAARTMRTALDEFCAPAGPQEAIARVLGAMHLHCRTQEMLYPLRRALRPVSLYFLEPALRARVDELDPEQPAEKQVGLFRVRDPARERSAFDLYVPESYDGTPWPLVVALHGGSGTGEDFLWSWLREARGRRFLLMAPTSLGSTWSMMGADIDAPALKRMVAYVGEGWKVDAERILLTGLSDGATYTLLCGLQEDMPFTALAPVSGVLHPANLSNGNLDRARGRRIYLVHGELDWMFPVAVARLAHEQLRSAGADVVFRPIADLSHTYPRDENDRILGWFDPALALPAAS
jgi:phospholipase/carboxylesterase